MSDREPFDFDSWFSTLRILGGAAATLLAALGLISPENVKAFQDALNALLGNLQQIVPLAGAAATAALTVWGFIRNSRKNKLLAVAADPSVARVLVKPNATGPVADAADDKSVNKVSRTQ